MQEKLIDIVARSFADDEDRALFDDLHERGLLVEIPEMWMALSTSGQRFPYLWEQKKAFWLYSEERQYDFMQAVTRGMEIIHYQQHDKTCCQRDADLWCRQIARPTWARAKLIEERNRWGREWSDIETRQQAQKRDAENHNSRYAPVTGLLKGQIWRMRWQEGNEVYALVTSLLGGCARLFGYYTVLLSPTYADRPRHEVWPWLWGEYRFDQQQIDRAFGPGKWAELAEA